MALRPLPRVLRPRGKPSAPGPGFALLCLALASYALALPLLARREAISRLPSAVRATLIDLQAVEAAGVQAAAAAAVRRYRDSIGLALDPDADRDMTGLVGVPYSSTTTTLGKLESKRSAATPEAAALVVRLLREVGVGPGSVVAVNASGSFPGFVLASMAACGAVGAEARLVLSLGSSSWGANDPRLCVADIAFAAIDGGAFPAGYSISVVGATPGGADDRGLDMDPESLRDMLARVEARGVPVLVPGSLEESVAFRRRVLDAGREADALLSIGGNYASSGADLDVALASGVIAPRTGVGADGVGLIQDYLRDGKPVVQLLNVERLYREYGLSYDAPEGAAANSVALYVRRSRLAAACALAPMLAMMAAYRIGLPGARRRKGARGDGDRP